ncbi:MAG: prepilin-type N-terminal cleavage/methylation domain-containing protein [bacterium]
MIGGDIPQPNRSAFSLVEVVVALGIVSFAVLAIVGMLPMALKSAQDSMRETDSTLIAQRIFSELQTGSGSNRSITKDTNGGTQTLFLTAHNSTNNFLGFKEDGRVNGFTTSAPQNADLDYYAQISVFTNTGISNLSRIQIDITAPAAAPPSARTTNSFTTLIGF